MVKVEELASASSPVPLVGLLWTSSPPLMRRCGQHAAWFRRRQKLWEPDVSALFIMHHIKDEPVVLTS